MYEPATSFTGYKIGLKDPSIFIGVPETYWKKEKVNVNYMGKVREYSKKDVVTHRDFNDKFRPGKKYTIHYLLWEKISNE